MKHLIKENFLIQSFIISCCSYVQEMRRSLTIMVSEMNFDVFIICKNLSHPF